jgi:GT2 family glycosyltransferase/glycosyltransferase involved in cell wall biosynthesis
MKPRLLPLEQDVAECLAAAAAAEEELEQRLAAAEAEAARLRDALYRSEAAREEAAHALGALRATKGFKILSTYWRTRDRVAPPGSPQRKALAAVKRIARSRGAEGLRVKDVAKSVLRRTVDQVLWGGSSYNPYDRLDPLKPIPVEVFGVDRVAPTGAREELRASLICTVYNEAASIEAWLESVARQKVQPDEVVIADGGSTDGTPERIEAFARSHPGLELRVLRSVGRLNIAQGRNLAIDAARNELIACTDAGCILEENWFGAIVAPMQRDAQVDVSMGMYTCAGGRPRTPYDDWFVSEPADPSRFLPSSRSVAFRKSAWRAAGGYPEWLTLTGEDTVFDLNLRKVSRKWAYVPSARVRWSAPRSLRDALKLAYRYGRGNGEAGLGAWFLNGYRWTLALRRLPRGSWFPLAIAASLGTKQRNVLRLVNGAGARGCVHGDRGRVDLLRSRGRMKGNVLILTGVPFYDCGGGQRGTQMALGFVRRGDKVTFVNVYPAYESNKSIYLETDFELLELSFFDHFDVSEWSERHRAVLAETTVVLEFPHPKFLPVVHELKRLGARVVYDCLDNWNSALGGDWYSDRAEREIVDSSDVLVASARVLVDRLANMTGREVRYLPQAVNAQAFAHRPATTPADLPPGEGPVLLYVGSLWGSWFDWELVLKTSQALPAARLVFIGEYGGQCPYHLPNAHFLGLKPHGELAGYLAASDVCLIPFKVDDITRAVNPLKVYEYLAMGKPVVSSELPELTGMPYVFTASADGFVESIRTALATKVDVEQIRRFVDANSWDNRVDALAGWVGARKREDALDRVSNTG